MPLDVPPVITKVYDVLLWLMHQVPKFPLSHRFVLGDRIQALVLEILEWLIEAAYTRNKAELLKRTGIQIEKLRYLMRISKDLQSVQRGVQTAFLCLALWPGRIQNQPCPLW